MATFAYRALAQSGEVIAGEVEAANEASAHTALRDRALTPFKLSRRSDGGDSKPGAGRRIRNENLATFLSDLAELTQAGISLRSALEVVQEGSAEAEIRALAADAAEAIAEGKDLDDVFASDQARYLAGLISAGRASGNLGLALRVGGDSVAREVAIRRELIDALSYPAFVFAALAFATGIILLVVAPALAPLLEDLPPGKAIILRGLVAVSVFVKANVLGLASIAMALALVGAFAARTDSGRFRLARLLAFGVPGGVVRDIEFGAWAMGAGYLLEAGVSAPMAAEQAVVFVRNAAVKRRVQNVSERIRDGQSFARAAQSIAGLPVTVASLAMIGEQAGSLPAMLRRSGEQCQARALVRLKAMTAIASPIALLALGALVGLMASGLLTGVSAIGEDALR